MWTKDFWVATLERVVATALAALLGTGVLAASDKLPDGHALASAGILVLTTAAFTLVKCILANLTNGGTGPGVGTVEVTPDSKAVEAPSEPAAAPATANVAVDPTVAQSAVESVRETPWTEYATQQEAQDAGEVTQDVAPEQGAAATITTEEVAHDSSVDPG